MTPDWSDEDQGRRPEQRASSGEIAAFAFLGIVLLIFGAILYRMG